MFQLIPFTREFCGDDANQPAAEFQFVCLGEITQAVVLRLASDLPRISVRAHLNSSEGDRGDGLA